MKITIGFSKPRKKKIFAELIRWFFKTDYSHVYIAVNSWYLGMRFVFEAGGTCVKFRSWKDFNEENETLYRYDIEIGKQEYREFMKFAYKNINKPYSIKGVLAIFLAKFGIRIGELRDAEYSYVCSELVGKVLKDFKDVRIDKPLDLVTPKDLKQILDKYEEG